MIITLTPAQVEALDDEDGLFSNAADIKEFPVPIVGYLGFSNGQPAIAHPGLTWEDEAVLHFILNERAADMARIKALPQGQQAAERAKVRADHAFPEPTGNSDERRAAVRARIRNRPGVAAAIVAATPATPAG